MKTALALVCWLWCAQLLAAPALWLAAKEGRQLWLFGSVHVADQRFSTLPPALVTALAKSDMLLLEVDPQALNAGPLAHLLSTGSDWPARLGPNLAHELEQAVRHSHQPQLRQLPPWFAALQLTQLRAAELGYHARLGIDMQLHRLAQKRGLPVTGLESPALAMELLASLAQRGLEDDFVSQTLQELEQIPEHLEHLLSTWLNGDEATLQALLSQQQSPELARFMEDELLARRNRLWLGQLEQLAPERALMVVGALHLYGDRGLIFMLKQAGYTLSRHEDPSLY